VLAQLRVGSTLTKHEDDGRYWIQLLAQHNKNGKPTVFALPSELTCAMDHYLEVVRPRLLTAKGGGEHDYVFVKRDGSAPRTDFTACTHLITQQVLGEGRAIGPHAFRSAVITAFYAAGSTTQSEMAALADIMAHDVATARAHYLRPIWAEQAVATNDKMARLLLGQA
jgi:integrase